MSDSSVGPEQGEGELLYPMPATLAATEAVRGSIIALDQRWLQSQKLFDGYVRALGPNEALAHVTTSEWLSFPAALAHWRALDALDVSSATAFEAGRFVGDQIHSAVLRTLARLAGKLGFTPWMALGNCHKFWVRSWRGGGVVVRRLGPAMASVDLVNACVARSRFFRSSLLGAIAVGLEPFCKRVIAVEREQRRTEDDVRIRVAWQ